MMDNLKFKKILLAETNVGIGDSIRNFEGIDNFKSIYSLASI